MAKKRSAHLVRTLIEGISAYSPYRGGKIRYVKDYDPSPTINIDVLTKMDIDRAIKALYTGKLYGKPLPEEMQNLRLSEQEVKMLLYVMLDGRLSRRDISAMIKENEGYYVDQRTISRRLESAYWKISRFLGWEYSDGRVFQIAAKKMGRNPPYILNDDEVESIQQTWERV